MKATLVPREDLVDLFPEKPAEAAFLWHLQVLKSTTPLVYRFSIFDNEDRIPADRGSSINGRVCTGQGPSVSARSKNVAIDVDHQINDVGLHIVNRFYFSQRFR